jgi:hypothetical protein
MIWNITPINSSASRDSIDKLLTDIKLKREDGRKEKEKKSAPARSGQPIFVETPTKQLRLALRAKMTRAYAKVQKHIYGFN